MNSVIELLQLLQNNIFNILASIPSIQDKPRGQHTELQINQEFGQVLYFIRSFGESYFLRGISPIPNGRNIKSYRVDIRILDYIYQVPMLYNYIDVLLFYSCIFSNESYKFTLLDLLNELNSINKMGIWQYEKQSLENEQQLILID
ncbi:unnamed protein product [Paramecium primaurelia]|uniref:Uncharacterized protein n=1 Tax=Paramecium primaurelia TaxID=5886 RepID=A0A8S1K6P6_PARPR|nr:unnamed protein product [Paramecium primaurelia]